MTQVTSSTLVVFMTNVSFCRSPSVDVLVTSGDSRPLTQFGTDVGCDNGAGGGPIIPGSAGLYAAVDGGGKRTASRPGRATG